MTYKVAKDTADWIMNNAKESGVPGSIGFFGGEPLLEWDTIIEPLTKYIRDDCRSNMSLGITSNCLLMDEDKLKFMSKYDIGLLISMDGDKATQDRNRPCRNGDSSFDILDKKLPLILKYFPESTFRSTIIPATCEYFCENLDYARRKGFTHSFAIINQFEEWPESKREELSKQVRGYSNYVIESFRKGEPIFRQRTLEQAINKIACINAQVACGNQERIAFSDLGRPCGLGSGYGSVNYKGDIFSCQEVASRSGEKDIFYLGNIYTGGVEKERQEALFNAVYKQTHIINSEDKKKCESCPLEATCDTNSCIVNNYIESKDFSIQSDNLCWWNNLMLREAQYICETLGNEDNEDFKDYFLWILTSEGGGFAYD